MIGISCGTKLCPVRALRAWMAAANITDGPIFRGVDRHGNILGRLAARAVAIVVKRYCEAAGLDPEKYAGHSLRAGMVTQAAMNGVPEHAIMRQTRHKSTECCGNIFATARCSETMRVERSAFENNPTSQWERESAGGVPRGCSASNENEDRHRGLELLLVDGRHVVFGEKMIQGVYNNSADL